MFFNTIAIMSYDYFIVNGIGKKYARRWKKNRQQKHETTKHVDQGGHELELTPVPNENDII